MAAKPKEMLAIVGISAVVDKTMDKAVDAAQKKLSKINPKALKVAAAIGGVATAAVAATAKAASYFKEMGEKFDDAGDTIRIGTGATGKALEGLNKDFEALYKSVPTTMEDASQAIADYNTRLGLNGETLQEISKQAIQVSDMLGEDLGAVIEKSSKAFQQWNISEEDMAEAMDYTFKVSQSVGTGFNDLLDTVQKFGPQMQEMGYSFEESTALIGKLDKAGVNMDEVMGAMKKSVGAMAKEGISAKDGISKYFSEIKNAKSAVEATTKANEIFGARAGSTVAAAIRDGTLNISDFTKELQENGETIGTAADDTYDYAEKMQMFKQKMEIATKPIATTIFEQLNKGAEYLADHSEEIDAIVSKVAKTASKKIEQILPIVKNTAKFIKNHINQIIPALIAVGSAVAGLKLMKLANNIGTTITQFKGMTAALKGTAVGAKILTKSFGVYMLIAAAVIAVGILVYKNWDKIKEFAIKVGKKIKEVFVAMKDSVVNAFKAMKKMVTLLFSAMRDAVKNTAIKAANKVKSVFGSMKDGVVNVFTAMRDKIGAIMSGLASIVKKPINAVIGIVNKLIDTVNTLSFDIPDWVPGIGGDTIGFNIPHLKMLETGGLTQGPSIAGEGRYPEMVITPDPRYRSENIGYLQEAGRMLGVDPAENYSIGNNSMSSVAIDMGMIEYKPVININGPANKSDILKALEEDRENFKDMLVELFAEIGEFAYV